MGYTLSRLISDCQSALKTNAEKDPENDAEKVHVEQVCTHLQQALADKQFCKDNLDSATKERDIIYEDKDLGFCICVHVYQGEANGNPHDHGPTWAIYGQAEGETTMTDWRIVTPASESDSAKVEKARTYTMVPGDAHVYHRGDVHAPYRSGPTKLVRIEGENCDHVKRTPIEAIA